jgi:hypothetical protein
MQERDASVHESGAKVSGSRQSSDDVEVLHCICTQLKGAWARVHSFSHIPSSSPCLTTLARIMMDVAAPRRDLGWLNRLLFTLPPAALPALEVDTQARTAIILRPNPDVYEGT